MMAMTTNNSISVNARRVVFPGDGLGAFMGSLRF
jgi:hypothetical protein